MMEEVTSCVSRYTTAERAAILRGSREACAAAYDLRSTLEELRTESDMLRSEAGGLRLESARLRERARAARAGWKRT
jgi:hypothetical protein